MYLRLFIFCLTLNFITHKKSQDDSNFDATWWFTMVMYVKFFPINVRNRITNHIANRSIGVTLNHVLKLKFTCITSVIFAITSRISLIISSVKSDLGINHQKLDAYCVCTWDCWTGSPKPYIFMYTYLAILFLFHVYSRLSIVMKKKLYS